MSISAEQQRRDKQQYGLLIVAEQDLQQAGSFAAQLLKKGWHHEPWERRGATYMQQSAFTTALVVAYCRPFTEVRGWPKFPTRLLAYSPDEKAQHGRLLRLRNAVYAHSDSVTRILKPLKFDGMATAIEAYPAMKVSKEDCVLLLLMIDKTTAAIRQRLQVLVDSVV